MYLIGQHTSAAENIRIDFLPTFLIRNSHENSKEMGKSPCFLWLLHISQIYSGTHMGALHHYSAQKVLSH